MSPSSPSGARRSVRRSNARAAGRRWGWSSAISARLSRSPGRGFVAPLRWARARSWRIYNGLRTQRADVIGRRGTRVRVQARIQPVDDPQRLHQALPHVPPRFAFDGGQPVRGGVWFDRGQGRLAHSSAPQAAAATCLVPPVTAAASCAPVGCSPCSSRTSPHTSSSTSGRSRRGASPRLPLVLDGNHGSHLARLHQLVRAPRGEPPPVTAIGLEGLVGACRYEPAFADLERASGRRRRRARRTRADPRGCRPRAPRGEGQRSRHRCSPGKKRQGFKGFPGAPPGARG